MSKKFSYYSDDIDHVWYDSSNVVYSECIDHDNKLKTLKVVFSNGTQYKYKDVDVRDYLIFRDSLSNGKELNRLIKQKGYEYEKLENADIEKLNEEYSLRSGNAYFISNNENGFELKSNKDEIIYSNPEQFDEKTMMIVESILKSIGNNVKQLKN